MLPQITRDGEVKDKQLYSLFLENAPNMAYEENVDS